MNPVKTMQNLQITSNKWSNRSYQLTQQREVLRMEYCVARLPSKAATFSKFNYFDCKNVESISMHSVHNYVCSGDIWQFAIYCEHTLDSDISKINSPRKIHLHKMQVFGLRSIVKYSQIFIIENRMKMSTNFNIKVIYVCCNLSTQLDFCFKLFT